MISKVLLLATALGVVTTVPSAAYAAQKASTVTAPLLAAHNDFIYLNAKLFQRFKTLHDNQATLNLNPEQAKLLDYYYKQFVHSGVQLDSAKQAELKTINGRVSTLRTKFNQTPL